jgi:hypothetical protein
VQSRLVWRSVARCLAVLVASVAVVSAAAGDGVAGSRAAEVPWFKAGSGWSIAQYSAASLPGAAHPVGARTVFYLVSPTGRKWPIYRTPAATTSPGFSLDDWSADRQRILVDKFDDQRDVAVVEQISLVTGTVISRFTMASTFGGPFEYTRPRGASVLTLNSSDDLVHKGIFRYSMHGHLQRRLDPRAPIGAFLDAPGGQFVTAGVTTGIDQISDNGTVTRRINIRGGCGAARWWTATTLLAACDGGGVNSPVRLWLIPFGAGAPTPLTPQRRMPRPAPGAFQGYADAFRTRGTLYLQAEIFPNLQSIVRLARDGTPHTVHVPGPVGVSPYIITARNGRLLLRSDVGTNEPRPSSLFWFNPATHAIHYLIRTRPGIYGVCGVIVLGYHNG